MTEGPTIAAGRRALAPTTGRGSFNQIPDSEAAGCVSPSAADLKRLSAPKSPFKQNSPRTPSARSLKSPKAVSDARWDPESSPVGAGLLALKVQRTVNALKQQRDAPAGSFESSPIGSGLLERKLQRAAAAALPRLDVGKQDDDEALCHQQTAAAFVDDLISSVFDEICGAEHAEDGGDKPSAAAANALARELLQDDDHPLPASASRRRA